MRELEDDNPIRMVAQVVDPRQVDVDAANASCEALVQYFDY